MEIRFSDHARRQMEERGLSEDMIVRTIRDTNGVTRQKENRYRACAFVRIGGKKFLLVVVYDMPTITTKEIVTAFLTTKFKKYS